MNTAENDDGVKTPIVNNAGAISALFAVNDIKKEVLSSLARCGPSVQRAREALTTNKVTITIQRTIRHVVRTDSQGQPYCCEEWGYDADVSITLCEPKFLN